MNIIVRTARKKKIIIRVAGQPSEQHVAKYIYKIFFDGY